MKCSIIIRAFNEEKHIGRLLEGISHQTIQDVEIILVDSGSTDATVGIAEKYGARVVHIPPEDFTFGRSLNLGLAAATRDLAVLASAHVYPIYPDWLERLLSPFTDPQTVLAYGKQRGGENSKFSEQQVFARWYPEQSAARQDHPFCNNANAAIRIPAWKQHPYDESLTGLEDLAWAKRCFEQGQVISYVAEAVVAHIHNETPSGVRNRYLREAMAFKRIYPEAHFNLYDLLRMILANISSDMWHALRQHVWWKSAISILWFRTMQFWGTYLGYRRSLEWTWQLRQTFYYPHGKVMPEQVERPSVEPIRYNH